MKTKIVIIGGGAAGFFLASNLKDNLNASVTILEKSSKPLQKVSVSGGGRCNVTHACFDPKELVHFYPRGHKELRSVFHRFQPADTMDWFEKRNVPLHIEEDNRIFPESNSSVSIVSCLLHSSLRENLSIQYNSSVKSIQNHSEGFRIKTQNDLYEADVLVICSGSSPAMWQLIEQLGHSIVPPVPSLFTFNGENFPYKELMGTSFSNAILTVLETSSLDEQQGNVLITHWGISGPAVLRLSAFGAKWMAEHNYLFTVKINWIGLELDDCIHILNHAKTEHSKKKVSNVVPFECTKRFWHTILLECAVNPEITFANLSKNYIQDIAKELTQYNMKVNGKSTFKEEFVTAGGVSLKEIDFKTMQSKLIPNLFFAGEVLDIDAVTGGFNFQACWSEAFIISEYFNKLL